MLVIPDLELTFNDPEPVLAAHAVAIGLREFVSVDEGIAGAARRGAPGFQSAAYVQGAAARSTGVSNETPYTGPAPSATAPSSVAAN